jgi:PadR family transcriptional regulator, regulatory protein PadR
VWHERGADAAALGGLRRSDSQDGLVNSRRPTQIGRVPTHESEGPRRVDLLQGALDLLILRTLLFGPDHGHAIAKHIQRSKDLLQVETGSLYPALHRLEAREWIEASWELSEKGKQAKYYRLTQRGKREPVAPSRRWAAFSRAVGLVLNPAESESL